MNDGGNMHVAAAPPGGPSNNTAAMVHPHRVMMHMTFFWAKNAEILFDGWPGYDNLGMYIFALAVVFLLAFLVEWLAHSDAIRTAFADATAAHGAVQTAVYAVRTGLAYLVMLSVMSFNAGVFLVAVAGHTAGFLLFGSKVFKKRPPGNYSKADDHSLITSC